MMEFKAALLEYNKEEVIKFTRETLSKEYGVSKFYYDYILDSLSSIGNEVSIEKYDIVQEHLCTAILRTSIEICYEYILKEKAESCSKSVVVCGLENELHELPPRITADFFLLNGFDTYFLGTNIPNEDIINSILHLNVDYIAISITNFLKLTNLHKLIEVIREKTECKIVIGGLAVINNKEYCQNLGVDYILLNFDEIGEILDETSNKNS